MSLSSEATGISRRSFLERSLRTACIVPSLAMAQRSSPVSLGAEGPLRVSGVNPRYFAQPSGRAVVLTGSHTWPNIVDMGSQDPPPRFDFDAYLEFLADYRHNFTRLWTWESSTWDTAGNGQMIRHHVAPLAWARTGPDLALDGKPRFDLTAYDDSFFERLRTRAAKAGRRGIYVSVMLFEGWAMQHAPGAWESHPFHPRNNIQGLDPDLNADGKGLEVHTLEAPQVTRLQEAYVRRVVETVNDLDNVLFEISNENHPASTAWQYHMIEFIRKVERSMPKQHPVGMTFQYKGGTNQALFDSPADWISPNPEGGYRDSPPSSDGRKVILNDTDHLWGLGGNVAWAWKSFLSGLNPIFMDPYDSAVLKKGESSGWDPLRRALGAIQTLASALPMQSLIPRPSLSSAGFCLTGREDAEIHLLTWIPGDSDRVALDLSQFDGRLQVVWIDPVTGESVHRGYVDGGGKEEVTLPRPSDTPGDLALKLKST